jgi:hypothetical protein
MITASIPLDSIRRRKDARHLNDDAVALIADSIAAVGQLNPITVRRAGDVFQLIAGSHRYAAVDSLGLLEIEAIIVETDDVSAEMMMIAENLHRAELTVLERDEQIALWVRLNSDRVSSQLGTKPQVGRPESGVNAAARELGIQKNDAHRAVKVAALAPEAKAAAREAGLDDNRSALFDAARQPTVERQVQAIRERVVARGGGIASWYASATAKAAPGPDLFNRFIKLVSEIEEVPVADLVAGAGRQRAVLGQRTSGLVDRLNQIMEALE